MSVQQEQSRRLWGLSVTEIHDRFWLSRGVVIVRRGDAVTPKPGNEWYLLLDRGVLLIADVAPVLEMMYWSGRRLVVLRTKQGKHDESRTTRQRVCAGEDGRPRFTPLRDLRDRDALGTDSEDFRSDPRIGRVMVATQQEVADAWRQGGSIGKATDVAQALVLPDRRGSHIVVAEVFDAGNPVSSDRFIEELARLWHRPSPAIAGVRQVDDEVWADEDSQVDQSVEMLGPVWVGAGRQLQAGEAVLGPAILWDAVERASVEPSTEESYYDSFSPAVSAEKRAARRVMVHMRQVSKMTWIVKRAVDILGASAGLLATLPLWPLIVIAIYLEDGRPFFFGHRRESRGGREFYCWKFRSMRKNAEAIKRQLRNEADGPQFFMKNDPRLTRIGKLIRITNLDELPQLWNVLVGDMSLVGPRPSPRAENQHFPTWREARLSVRPGLTGLWQVERTRAPGIDFQEWVRYDLEYVERLSLLNDLKIILRTIPKVLKGGGNGR